MTPDVIDDPADPRLADFVGLKDAERRARDVIVVEGLLAVAKLEGSPFAPRAFLVTPAKAGQVAELAARCQAPLWIASQTVMDAVTGFHIHRGVVASADAPPPPAPGAVLAASRRVAVLEDVNDHENLGALFRNAAAFGIDAVLACPRTADPYYRRSIRVSLGHALRVPFTRLDPWPQSLDLMREHRFRLLALTPDVDAPSLTDVALAPDERIAVLLGAEGPGLTDGAMAAAHDRVRIAMTPGVDSLNVATAGAIAFQRLFELGRG